MMNLSIVHSGMVLQGYLLKGASTEELYEAIKVVHQGGAMINLNIASKVFKFSHKWPNQLLLLWMRTMLRI